MLLLLLLVSYCRRLLPPAYQLLSPGSPAAAAAVNIDVRPRMPGAVQLPPWSQETHYHRPWHKHSVAASHPHKHMTAATRLWRGDAPPHPVAVLNLPCVESKNCCSASPCACSYSCACVDNKQDQAARQADGAEAGRQARTHWCVSAMVLFALCVPPSPCEGSSSTRMPATSVSVTCMPY